MTKHSMFTTQMPPKPSKLPMHPIWRGVGLIMLVVLPAMSYLIASVLINNKGNLSWIVIPSDIILYQYPKDPLILVRLLYAAIILLIIAAVLAFVTFLTARLLGPSRYDPYDLPPGSLKK